MQHSAVDQRRHYKAAAFVIVSLTLAILVNLWLGFSKGQTLGYGVATYVALIALNYRSMLAYDPLSIMRDLLAGDEDHENVDT